jgi:hypothetical protein
VKKIGVAVLVAALFAGAALADSPTTTAASGPVDFVTLLNAEYGNGVTAENNGALELLEMIGPAENGRGTPAEIFDALKISKTGYRGRFFAMPLEYMKIHYGDDYQLRKNSPGVKAEEATRKTLWAKEDCPPIAEWLKDSDWALETIAEAVKKERFYVPLHSASKPARISDTYASRPMARWRTMADGLHARALLRWRAGEKADAIADLQTELKLSAAIAKGPYMLDQLIGLAIERQVYGGVTLIAREGGVSEKDARALLAAFGPAALTRFAASIDRGERLSLLEICAYSKTNPREAGESMLMLDARMAALGKKNELPIGDLAKVDWDAAAKVVGEIYDERLKAAGSENYSAGKQAYAKLEGRIAEATKSAELEPLPETTDWDKVDWQKRSAQSNDKLAAFLKMEKDETVEAFSRRIAMQLANDHGIWQRTWNLTWLTRQQGDLARVAVALAGFKAEKGKLPEKLEALSPEWMKEMPADYFSAAGLKYVVDKDGAIVYSVGPDGKDDAGKEGKNLLEGDVAVRVK